MKYLKYILVLLYFALASGASAASSQSFPSRPVTIQVAYGAGGSTDRQIRLLAQIVGERLGQQVIVENKPGAGGTLAASTLAASGKADGYTLAQAPVSVYRLPQMQKTPWDPIRDFTFVTGISGYVLAVGVRSDSPFKTWEDLANYARSHPGQMSYASVGMGSTQHLGMSQIQRKTGLEFNHIPYKGASESSLALLGGQVTFAAEALSTFIAMGDKARILMVWEPERFPSFPNVPTAKELGIDLVAQSPYGLIGPKGMPDDLVKTLSDAFRQALLDPRHLELLKNIQQSNWPLGSDEYRAYANAALKDERQNLEAAGLLPSK